MGQGHYILRRWPLTCVMQEHGSAHVVVCAYREQLINIWLQILLGCLGVCCDELCSSVCTPCCILQTLQQLSHKHVQAVDISCQSNSQSGFSSSSLPRVLLVKVIAIGSRGVMVVIVTTGPLRCCH